MKYPSVERMQAQCEGDQRDWLLGELESLGVEMEPIDKRLSVDLLPSVWFYEGTFQTTGSPLPDGYVGVGAKKYLELVKKDLAEQQPSELEALRAENAALKARIAELEPKPKYVDQFEKGDDVWIRFHIEEVDPSHEEGCTLRVRNDALNCDDWVSDSEVDADFMIKV